jgi:hypothetical protein
MMENIFDMADEYLDDIKNIRENAFLIEVL